MKSLQQEEIGAALDAVDAGYARLRAACSDSVGNAFRVDLAERLERQHRINRGLMYRVFGELIEPPDGPDDPDLPAGAVISKLLWQRLRITSADIKHRIAIAARIRPRRSLTGPQLPPELPRLAAAVENGDLGEAHITRSARRSTPAGRRPLRQERRLREDIGAPRPKPRRPFVTGIGKAIAEYLNPDGDFDDTDRARRRGLTLGPQGPDGMSHVKGWIDPEARGYFETARAAVRPGRHQPHDDTDESNEPEPGGHFEVTPDPRTASQRLHDAVKLGMRAGIASGAYGQHRGLPVTVIVTTTLSER